MADVKSSPATSKIIILATGLIIFAFFLLGTFFPDAWWGTHYSAFLPQPFSGLLLLSCAGLMILGYFKWPAWSEKFTERSPGKALNWLLPMGLALIACMVFYALPIDQDNYGNSATYHDVLMTQVDILRPGIWGDLFSLKLTTGQGRTGVHDFVQVLSHTFGITILKAYRVLGAFCGALFIGIWVAFVRFYFSRTLPRILMMVVGGTTPMIQVFCGHVESYAPVFLVLTGFLLLLLVWLRSGKDFALWSCIPILVLGIRLNALLVLLVPVLGLAIAWRFLKDSEILKKLMSLKGILLFLFLPMAILGLVAYFFVFKDHHDPRTLDDFKDIDRLFLPLFPPAPPLDRYNLLSGNHFFDYFNMLLCWSPPALLVLISIMVGGRKNIDVNKADFLLPLLAFLLLGAMLFMINPLFSMPMDWDLFCIAVPPLLVLVAALAQQVEDHPLLKQSLPAALALGLLLVPVLTVNHSTLPHSNRLQSVGIHIYKTYHLHSGRYLLYSLFIAKPQKEEFVRRKTEILDKMRPHAVLGVDDQFSDLLVDQAIYYYQSENDLARAKETFLEADQYFPLTGAYNLKLMEVHFLSGEPKEAHDRAVKLIAAHHPDDRTALRAGIHTALEASLYDAAEEHSAAYLVLFPEDQKIRLIHDRLVAKENVGELKSLFSGN